MLTPDRIRLDFRKATIVVDRMSFKASVATYVDNRTCDPNNRCIACQPFAACLIGGRLIMTDETWDRGWQILHPMPNGVMAQITVSELCSVSLALVSQTILQTVDDKMLWPMMVVGRTIVPALDYRGVPLSGGASSWEGCDAEWLAEYLARLSRFAVEPPQVGPRAKLVPISDLRVRPRGMVMS